MSPATPPDSATARTPLPLVTITLVLLNIAVYIIQGLRGASWIDPTPDQLLAAGGNVAMLTLTGDAWRLLTSVFVHGGPVHLLMNMYMLFLVGSLAERKFGRIGFLLLFLAGGVVASCASTWWQSSHTLGTDLLGRSFVRLTVSVGASGAIMAILGALLSAHAIRSAFGDHHDTPELGLGKSLVQVIAINVGMGFLIPGVDNSAHVGGVVAGLLMGALLQFAAERAGSLPQAMLRIALPPALAAAVAWALLNGSDWSDMRELRTMHDEQAQAEKNETDQRAAAAAVEQAAEQERQQLPPPVSDQAARGQVIKFGDSGTSFALSPDGNTAYAVDHQLNQISVIDLQRGVVVKTISGPKVPIKNDCMDIFCGSPASVDIAILRGKSVALVTSMQKDAVVYVDLATGQPSKAVSVGKTPNAILMSQDDRLAYVHNVGDDSISVIDVEKAAVEHTLRLPKQNYPNTRPGHRLPMWLNADGTRLFAAQGSQNNPQIHVFDVKSAALLSSEGLRYEVTEAIPRSGAKNEVAVLSEEGLIAMNENGTDDAAAWPFCSGLRAMHFAASRPAKLSEYVAIADYRGYNGEDSMVHVANLRTSVTIGRYPIPGVAMKLMMSADGSRVYAVTNGGEFVVLDTRQRLGSRESGELLCSR